MVLHRPKNNPSFLDIQIYYTALSKLKEGEI